MILFSIRLLLVVMSLSSAASFDVPLVPEKAFNLFRLLGFVLVYCFLGQVSCNELHQRCIKQAEDTLGTVLVQRCLTIRTK